MNLGRNQGPWESEADLSVPNTIVKIVNKHGQIEDFDLSRIVRSINLAIVDVNGNNLGISQHRALRYAKSVAARVYREYYDLDWNKTQFITQYVSYEPAERHDRLNAAFITLRMSFVLLEKFKDRLGAKKIQDCADDLRAFIRAEIDSAQMDVKFTEGLFPKLTDDVRADMASYLASHVLDLAAHKPSPSVLCPTREYLQDTIERELKDLGEIEVAEGYMIYREGRRKIHSGDISELQFTRDGIPRDHVRRTLEWNIDHECDSIFALNDWILGRNGKDIRDLIQMAEARFREDILSTAQKILDLKGVISVVIIAGPSCSNKTTTTVIIGTELKRENLRFRQLNVDDYFFDLAQQPKDEFGDYDFEMPEAIDIELLNQHLEALLAGREIQKPKYNFKKGCRDGYEPFHLEPGEIVLIDCLHGLYRRLTSAVPQHRKFRIYIESMNVIRNVGGAWTRWADVRMMKRMIRDARHRGYSTEQTLAHWSYVRKGELKHIIPYIFSTDSVINSGLPYELVVLKHALKDILPDLGFIQRLRAEGRLDPYVRGIRVHSLLTTLSELAAWDHIPNTSPIREFIGGSVYLIPHND